MLGAFKTLNLIQIKTHATANFSDPKSPGEIIKICHELVDKIEALEKLFVVPERLK